MDLVKKLNRKKLAGTKVTGVLEAPSDYLVIRGKPLCLRGWLDWDDQNYDCLVIKINEESYRLIPQTPRGDIVQKSKLPKARGFRFSAPVEALKSNKTIIKLEVKLRSGETLKWQERTVWLNSASDLIQNPVISSRVEEEGNNYHLIVEMRELGIAELIVIQNSVVKFSESYSNNPKKIIAEVDQSLLTPSYPAYVHIRDSANKRHFADLCNRLNNTAESDFPRRIFAGVIYANKHHIDLEIEPEDLCVYVNGEKADFEHIVNSNRHSVGLDTSCWPSLSHVDVYSSGNCLAMLSYFKYGISEWRALNGEAIILPSASAAGASTLKPDNLKRVVVIRRSEAPTDELYCLSSLFKLQSQYNLAVIVVDTDKKEFDEVDKSRLLQDGSFVIVSRYIPEDWISYFFRHKYRLGSIFYLMDDDVLGAHSSTSLPNGYRSRMRDTAFTDFQSMLMLCDRFIATSSFLYKKYYSPKTLYLSPPYLSKRNQVIKTSTNEAYRLAYHGTKCHQDDLEMLAPALKRVLDKNSHASLQIAMGGFVPKVLKEHPRVEVIGLLDWHEYKDFRDQQNIHISLVPLLDTHYNRGKSIIKLMDSAALGAVGIYTNTQPYNEVITHGENGFLLENDPLMWEKAIQLLIDKPDVLDRMRRKSNILAKSLGKVSSIENFWRKQFGLNELVE